MKKDYIIELREEEADELMDEHWVGELIRCKDCKHGSLYMTEDVCGKTLIECNHPNFRDAIAIFTWDWFCADGEREEGR